MVDALGSSCVRCGFDDRRALQVDHIHGGGNEERRQHGFSTTYYRQMLSHLHDYQILCANCNWIKKHENRESRQRLDVVA